VPLCHLSTVKLPAPKQSSIDDQVTTDGTVTGIYKTVEVI